MKCKKSLLALAVSALALTSVAVTPDWQRQVDEFIAQGEFARAEKLMKSLPKKVRQADAVRIDSLRTIMQRIPRGGCEKDPREDARGYRCPD